MAQAGAQRPLHPIVAVGSVLLLAGLGAWIWTGEWRWAATGALILVFSSVIAAMMARYAKPHRSRER